MVCIGKHSGAAMTVRSLQSALRGSMLGVLLCVGACTLTGIGVGYDGGEYDDDAEYGGPGYVGGFYEPYGYEYGGWGGGYQVGPPLGEYRDGMRGDFRGGRSDYRGGGVGRTEGAHPYHSAPPGRSMPSLPGRSRGH